MASGERISLMLSGDTLPPSGSVSHSRNCVASLTDERSGRSDGYVSIPTAIAK
jgi:hypothetical protein